MTTILFELYKYNLLQRYLIGMNCDLTVVVLFLKTYRYYITVLYPTGVAINSNPTM